MNYHLLLDQNKQFQQQIEEKTKINQNLQLQIINQDEEIKKLRSQIQMLEQLNCEKSLRLDELTMKMNNNKNNNNTVNRNPKSLKTNKNKKSITGKKAKVWIKRGSRQRKQRLNKSYDNDSKSTPSNTNDDDGFKCSICGQLFMQKHSFQNHEKFHNDNNKKLNPYPCDLCTKSFPTKYQLDRHRKIHSKNCNKTTCKYQCEICSNRFDHENDLVDHQREIHNDNMTSNFDDQSTSSSSLSLVTEKINNSEISTAIVTTTTTKVNEIVQQQSIHESTISNSSVDSDSNENNFISSSQPLIQLQLLPTSSSTTTTIQHSHQVVSMPPESQQLTILEPVVSDFQNSNQNNYSQSEILCQNQSSYYLIDNNLNNDSLPSEPSPQCNYPPSTSTTDTIVSWSNF